MENVVGLGCCSFNQLIEPRYLDFEQRYILFIKLLVPLLHHHCHVRAPETGRRWLAVLIQSDKIMPNLPSTLGTKFNTSAVFVIQGDCLAQNPCTILNISPRVCSS